MEALFYQCDGDIVFPGHVSLADLFCYDLLLI